MTEVETAVKNDLECVPSIHHKQLFIFSWLMTGIVETPLPFSS